MGASMREGGIGGSVTRHAAVRSRHRPAHHNQGALTIVIDLPNALFGLCAAARTEMAPGGRGGWPTIGSRHRYTSREVLLGAVEEA